MVKTVAQGWVPINHGIPSSYVRGCRCEECRAAQAKRQRDNGYGRDSSKRFKAKRVLIDGRLIYPDPPLGHGRRTTYIQYGCRCEKCTAADSAYHRDRRASRKAKTQ